MGVWMREGGMEREREREERDCTCVRARGASFQTPLSTETPLSYQRRMKGRPSTISSLPTARWSSSLRAQLPLAHAAAPREVAHGPSRNRFVIVARSSSTLNPSFNRDASLLERCLALNRDVWATAFRDSILSWSGAYCPRRATLGAARQSAMRCVCVCVCVSE